MSPLKVVKACFPKIALNTTPLPLLPLSFLRNCIDALPKASTLAAQTRLLLRSNFCLDQESSSPYLFDTPLQELVRCPQQTRAGDNLKLTCGKIKERRYKNYHPAWVVFRNQSDIDRAVAV